jgi:hypothetical protein
LNHSGIGVHAPHRSRRFFSGNLRLNLVPEVDRKKQGPSKPPGSNDESETRKLSRNRQRNFGTPTCTTDPGRRFSPQRAARGMTEGETPSAGETGLESPLRSEFPAAFRNSDRTNLGRAFRIRHGRRRIVGHRRSILGHNSPGGQTRAASPPGAALDGVGTLPPGRSRTDVAATARVSEFFVPQADASGTSFACWWLALPQRLPCSIAASCLAAAAAGNGGPFKES